MHRPPVEGIVRDMMNCKDLEDLWDARCCLEAMAARLACARVGPEDIRQLDALCDLREAAARQQDDEAVDRADLEFHRRIIELSGNEVIEQVFRETALLDRVFRLAYRAPSYRPQDEQAPYGHRKIVEALARHDPAAAETLVREHVLAGKRQRLETLAVARQPVRKRPGSTISRGQSAIDGSRSAPAPPDEGHQL